MSDQNNTQTSHGPEPMDISEGSPQGSRDIFSGPLTRMSIVTLIFFFTYTGGYSLEYLQSSINPEGGLGSTSVAILCILTAVSAGIGSSVVQWLSPKYAMLLGSAGELVFVLCNFYPTYISLYLGSVLFGLVSIPAFVAQAIYLVDICRTYATVKGKSYSHILSTFTGIFQFVLGAGKPIGFLIAAIVLRGAMHSDLPQDALKSPLNSNKSVVSWDVEENNFTNFISNWSSKELSLQTRNYSLCGARHCLYLVEHTKLLVIPSQDLVYILVSVYAVFAIIAITLSLTLKKMPCPKVHSAWREFKHLFFFHKKHSIQLLIPSFFIVGITEAMEAGSYYPSFVSCALGLNKLSYVMMVEGATLSITALISGLLSSTVPKIVQMVFAFFTNFTVCVTWLLWHPNPNDAWLFFLLAILQGCSLGIYRTQLQLLLIQMYHEDSGTAISVYFLHWFFFKSVVFAYSPYLCFDTKAYIYLATILCALCTYISLHVRQERVAISPVST